VIVNLYQQAGAAVGVPAPRSGGAAAYFAKLAQRAGVAGSDLTQGPGVDTSGVDLAQIRADMTAGDPPDDVLAAVGTFDTGAINRAAHADPAWHTALSTGRDDGVTVYRWLRDNQTDISRGTGILSELPGSRRLAVPNPHTLLLTRNTPTMNTVLDSATGHGRSYADNPGVTDVATRLDDMHAYAAILSTQQHPLASILGKAGTPAAVAALQHRMAGQELRPYLLAGMGVTRLQGKPAMLVVLANADNATAQANATALRTAVDHGISVRANEPWSKLLTVADVHADGNLTVGTFTEANASLWIQIVQGDDSLLVTP
jgi:hypothetical protein